MDRELVEALNILIEKWSQWCEEKRSRKKEEQDRSISGPWVTGLEGNMSVRITLYSKQSALSHFRDELVVIYLPSALTNLDFY